MTIVLASQREIAAQKCLWLIEHPDREPSTYKRWDPDKKWRYTDERARELRRIDTACRLAERKRKAACQAVDKEPCPEKHPKFTKSILSLFDNNLSYSSLKRKR